MTILSIVSVGALVWLYKAGRGSASSDDAEHIAGEHGASPGELSDAEAAPAKTIAFSNETIEAAHAECLKLAFGVARIDYQIMGEHAAVLARIGEAADASVHQRDYFPRRPMLLPKLMQALNDPESTREELARLILEDPAIAGGVLQQANTAFYRVSPARVDSIDRAVWLLGTDGLRRLMATAIMQPVFRLPKGYFDHFATYTWEQAQRAAAAAEAYARSQNACDPFVAQLLAVLEPLARIVVFRLAMEKYRESPNILPRAEVFIRAMQRHGSRVALQISGAWEMSDESRNTLRDQSQRESPSSMRELSRAVYYANLTSAFTLLAVHSSESEKYVSVLIGQGLEEERAQALWRAATSACEATT